jgi:hypothetical protein
LLGRVVFGDIPPPWWNFCCKGLSQRSRALVPPFQSVKFVPRRVVRHDATVLNLIHSLAGESEQACQLTLGHAADFSNGSKALGDF